MRILHVSDLHVVADDNAARCESPHGSTGNSDLIRRVIHLAEIAATADAIVFSGDITDAGSAEEWKEFWRMLERLPASTRSRIFAVPGNHDLNYVSNLSGMMRTDTSCYDGRHIRSVLTARAISMLQGERCKIARFGQGDEVSFIRFDQFFIPSALESQNPRGSQDFDVDDLFPYVWTFTSHDGLNVAMIGINTIGVGLTVFDNALGRFQVGKILRTVAGLEKAGYFPIIVGHHHLLPIQGAERPIKGFKDWFCSMYQLGKHLLMDATDGSRLSRELRKILISRGFVYLHGHRHVTRAKSGSGAFILGAPSMQFGDEHTGSTEAVALLHELTLTQPGSGYSLSSVNVRTSVLNCPP